MRNVLNEPIAGQAIARQLSFTFLRMLFGFIWVLNAWFQANSAYINHLFLKSFNAGITGQPLWLSHFTEAVINGIQLVGPARVAWVTVAIDAVLALSLISGIWLRFFACVGIVYNLFMWLTVGGMGGPYTQGATDPGTAIVYALAFFFVLLTRSWSNPSMASDGADLEDSPARLYDYGRLAFGLLWAFDAFLKWRPYFLHHAADYLVQAQQGQPAWIVAYIQFFINLIHMVGPFTFGLFAAILESLIAASLLSKKWLDFMLPIGALYSLVLWTTAEGWGGPYGSGFTGNRGDILGTAIIYCLIFLYLMVIYPPFWTRKTQALDQHRDNAEGI